jgi:hypothetical protein
MGKIHFRTTSDVTQLERDNAKLQRQYAALLEKMQKMAGASRKANREERAHRQTSEQSAGINIRQLSTMALGWGLVQQAVKAVNMELEAQRQLQQSALQAQKTTAAAQAEFVINLGVVSQQQAQAQVAAIQQISKEAGFERAAPVFQAASGLISATSSEELTKNILREMAPTFQVLPQQLSAASQAVGDIAGIMNIQSREDIRAAIGLIVQTQQQARITKLEAFANAAPGIAAAAATMPKDIPGAERVREGAALFAAVGKGITDPFGATTATAVSGISRALREILPEKDVVGSVSEQFLDEFGRIRTRKALGVVREGTGLRTIEQRLAAVQQSQQLQIEFMEKATGLRGAAKTLVQEMISDPESKPARRFLAALQTIQLDPEAPLQLQENLQATTALRMASASARARGLGEGALLERSMASREAFVREALFGTAEQPGLLHQAGIPAYLRQGRERFGFPFHRFRGRQPEEIAIAELARAGRAAVHRARLPGGEAGVEISQGERALLDAIKDMILLMQQQLEETRKPREPSPAAAQLEAGRHLEN